MPEQNSFPDYFNFSSYYKIIEEWKSEGIDSIFITLIKRGLLLYSTENIQINEELSVISREQLKACLVSLENVATAWSNCEYLEFPWPTGLSDNSFILLNASKYRPRPNFTEHGKVSRKLNFKKEIKCKKCSEECYRYYFNKRTINVKDAANLLCGADPRSRTLKYHQGYFKAFYEAFKRATRKRRPELKLMNGNRFDKYSLLNSNLFFKWAAEKHPDFNDFLPEGMPWIKKTGYLDSYFNLGVELSHEEKERVVLLNRIKQLASEAAANEPLLKEGDKYIKYRKSQSEKAKKPRRGR